MRTARCTWIPLSLALASVLPGCATAAAEISDAAGILPVGDDAGTRMVGDANVPIIIIGGDSGSITIVNDGGQSSLNPPVDAGAQQSDATMFPQGDGGSGFGNDSSAPPGDDGSSPSEDAGSGSGSSSSSGGTVPTTCTEADDTTGCCVGDTRYHCSAGGTLETTDCTTTGKVCGWSTSAENYGCVAAPATSDPEGTPIACGGSGTGSGSSTASSSGSHSSSHSSSSSSSGGGTSVIPTTCAGAGDDIGCCGPNGKNYYCTGTSVKSTTCPSGTTCGWGSDGEGDSYYGCVTGGAGQSDPSGTYPIACQ